MKYQQKSFTLPAGPVGISQEEWDRIFGKKIVSNNEDRKEKPANEVDNRS